MTPLLTPADVAAQLQVPLRTAREIMYQMPHYRIGKHLRVTQQALTHWLQRREDRAGPLEMGDLSRGAGSASPVEPIHPTQPRRRRDAPTDEQPARAPMNLREYILPTRPRPKRKVR